MEIIIKEQVTKWEGYPEYDEGNSKKQIKFTYYFPKDELHVVFGKTKRVIKKPNRPNLIGDFARHVKVECWDTFRHVTTRIKAIDNDGEEIEWKYSFDELNFDPHQVKIETNINTDKYRIPKKWYEDVLPTDNLWDLHHGIFKWFDKIKPRKTESTKKTKIKTKTKTKTKKSTKNKTTYQVVIGGSPSGEEVAGLIDRQGKVYAYLAEDYGVNFEDMKLTPITGKLVKSICPGEEDHYFRVRYEADTLAKINRWITKLVGEVGFILDEMKIKEIKK